MTREKLLELIKDAPLQIYVSDHGLKFSVQDDDGTIYAKWISPTGYEFTAFLMQHAGNKMDEFHFSQTGDLQNARHLIDFMNMMNDFLDAGVAIAGEIKEIVREVKVEDHESKLREENLKGQVSVYERLTSRPLTIS